jgi:hypothetical protein
MEHCERCKEMNDGYCELSFDLQGYLTQHPKDRLERPTK